MEKIDISWDKRGNFICNAIDLIEFIVCSAEFADANKLCDPPKRFL
jgi:hypothetical protein